MAYQWIMNQDDYLCRRTFSWPVILFDQVPIFQTNNWKYKFIQIYSVTQKQLNRKMLMF